MIMGRSRVVNFLFGRHKSLTHHKQQMDALWNGRGRKIQVLISVAVSATGLRLVIIKTLTVANSQINVFSIVTGMFYFSFFLLLL
jgi:hypothetical protein